MGPFTRDHPFDNAVPLDVHSSATQIALTEPKGGRVPDSIVRGSQSNGEHREYAGEGVAKYGLSAG